MLKSFSGYVDDRIVLDLLNKGEEKLEKDYLCSCSRTSTILFNTLDLKEISAKRKKNAEILHLALTEMKIKHIWSYDATPLFVPIFINEGRDHLRKKFFEQGIFTPQHWPRISFLLNGNNLLYKTELSLICDQRYDKKEMIRQIEVLRENIM